MPKITQYIRNEDWPAWQSIKNKSEWIHRKLQEEGSKKESKPINKVIYTKTSNWGA